MSDQGAGAGMRNQEAGAGQCDQEAGDGIKKQGLECGINKIGAGMRRDQGFRYVVKGYKFRPTNEELIGLLRCKAAGVDISRITVFEKNMYGNGTEPWKVFADIDDGKWEFYNEVGTGNKKVIYVITKLSQVNGKKTKRRTAGCGSWEGRTKATPVMNDQGGDKIIGYTRMLSYMVDPGYESAAAGKSYYYMHEYSCSQDYMKEGGITTSTTDYVICRVIRDDSKSCQIKP